MICKYKKRIPVHRLNINHVWYTVIMRLISWKHTRSSKIIHIEDVPLKKIYQCHCDKIRFIILHIPYRIH
jgi:hypothetical protein